MESKLDHVLDKITELIIEAKSINCPYVGIFALEKILRECGREVEDDD